MNAQEIAKQLRDMAEFDGFAADGVELLNAAADIADKHAKMLDILFGYSSNPGATIFQLLKTL